MKERGNPPSLPETAGTGTRLEYELCLGWKQSPFPVTFARKCLPIRGGKPRRQAGEGLGVWAPQQKESLLVTRCPRGVACQDAGGGVLDSPDSPCPLSHLISLLSQESNWGNRLALHGFDYCYWQPVRDNLPRELWSRLGGNERRKCPCPYAEPRSEGLSQDPGLWLRVHGSFNPVPGPASEGP